MQDHFSFSEVLAIIDQEMAMPGSTGEWQSNQLHRWIGERHMADSDRHPGSGNVIVYNEKDVRRSVAYLRLRAIAGEAIGSHARKISDRVRDIAAWHSYGFVIVTDGHHTLEHVSWTAAPVPTIEYLLNNGTAFIIIPCSVAWFEIRTA